MTIIETNGPAAGVDLVVGDPDQEDPRLHQQEESVSGEKCADEQGAVEETEVSQQEVVTNEEILIVEEEVAAPEEAADHHEGGSDKQESEEDEMEEGNHLQLEDANHLELDDPPASDSSSISIPPSPIPKEVIFKSGPICIRLCKLGKAVGLCITLMHPLYAYELYYAGSPHCQKTWAGKILFSV